MFARARVCTSTGSVKPATVCLRDGGLTRARMHVRTHFMRSHTVAHTHAHTLVLCQDGNDRQVKPIAVQSIKRWRDGTAVDRERNEVRKGFMVKVLEGPFKGRGGKVPKALICA